ncbi:PREDICTED: coiled-coil domain-containing protein 82-like [Rhagoletis zephyria]|uniref:coiled-coil domain-containing protein 82-like n=1 Tax=Rhagoletis zephyria TaxID=28612 RepID=UPI0008115BBC|nr:PREDICTED: coiled-coil domain-containing protein 82-like [Rhagoletis zephyria]
MLISQTGDFIVLRSDLVNDWPIIWQVDTQCILQKYEPFCQNGKMFYRNMSMYSSWNLDSKKLYVKAPVRIQVQSHKETIVEFMRSELLADDTEQFIEKIMEDFLRYRDNFEIYIQTMISQVLDPSFFLEITREKDEYFLGSVRIIDSIMDNCKRKLLSITPWTRSIIVSIETYPKCHVFTEWGQNNLTQKNCGGCHQPGISVRFLLFGNPYHANTMQPVPVDTRLACEKDILLCRICAARADIFHKIAHEKFNLYIHCSRRVAEQQQEYPGKSSTEILNDLLAEHNWVDELFRNMRNSWAEVESLERQKRFREVSQ